jgi:chromosome segregation ATPase
MRRVPPRAPESQREATQRALDQFMEDFRHLDSSQRALRGMVDSFRAYLPDRAASSGLVPRFGVLDQEAEAIIGEYLRTLDEHPFGDDLDVARLGAAHRAYADVGPRMATLADAMDQVVLDYDAELTRIGQQVQRGRHLKEQATAFTKRVADAAGTLRSSGLEVPELNGLLARTRAAATTASEWEPERGFEVLEQAVRELDGLAEQVEALATEYPQRIAKARTRRASLRTVADGIESRRARVPDDLATLRREFSMGNWRDLDDSDGAVTAALDRARAALAEFDRLVAADADWSRPLQLLDEARAQLDAAKHGVDAPHERLQRLREIKADPEELLRRVRFRLRDAQLLVTNNRKAGGEAVSRELDALAVRLDGLRKAFDAVHPDYWAAAQEAERMQETIRAAVERFRGL